MLWKKTKTYIIEIREYLQYIKVKAHKKISMNQKTQYYSPFNKAQYFP